MNRKAFFLVSLALSLAIRLHMNLDGRESDGLLALLLAVIWMAYLLPVSIPIVLAERLFHFAPWDGDGHWLFTTVAMILCATSLWFFSPRLARMLGTFDAVSGEGNRRLLPFLPTPSEVAATALDKWNRSRVGKGKMGGWA